MTTNYFSYKIEHDFGLAPNPFGAFCTLAVCKPKIRNNKHLKIGDWILGTGSKALGNLQHLIYAIQVEEKLTFDQYWTDDRFQYKKPVINGSLVQMYGDNFYHKDPKTGEWIQENSAHSLKGGLPNQKHIDTDTGGEYVLISKTFYYFGDESFQIKEEFLKICSNGRGMKRSAIPNEVAEKFIEWLQDEFTIGIHGNPINWKQHKS